MKTRVQASFVKPMRIRTHQQTPTESTAKPEKTRLQREQQESIDMWQASRSSRVKPQVAQSPKVVRQKMKSGSKAALFAQSLLKKAPRMLRKAVLVTAMAANIGMTMAPPSYAAPLQARPTISCVMEAPALESFSPLGLQVYAMQMQEKVTDTVSCLLDQAEQALTLEIGSSGEIVLQRQQSLEELGFRPGKPDGSFGNNTARAVRRFQAANELAITGVIDGATHYAFENSPSGVPVGGISLPEGVESLDQYMPYGEQTIALFKAAAEIADVPVEWASADGLHQILTRESKGQVGVPNYSYGARAKTGGDWASVHQELKDGKITATSSATGLGQLLSSNVAEYYPSGLEGIGNPLEEAVGMLEYIQARYETPTNAWAKYGKLHEGY